MILGAVLAGGQSSRFGSDKALAELDGRTLLDRAKAALARLCDSVIVVGREPGIPDWPRPGMGPLGGIAAALRHGQSEGFESVLTCGVDSADLPENLLERLSPASAYAASQPVIGHWRSDAAAAVEAILQSDARHSMLAFAEAIGARPVRFEEKPANINTPEDLAALEHRDGI